MVEREEPKVGEFYEHYKGGKYKIVALARDSEDPEKIIVVYQALYMENSGDLVANSSEFSNGQFHAKGGTINRIVHISEEYGKDVVWARPLSEFMEEIEKDGKKVMRFERIQV